MSGPRALRIGQQLFVGKPNLGSHARRVVYGQVIDDLGLPVDEALAWFLAAPSTYTGEDVVEISTHGSGAVLELVVDRGHRLGAELAQPGEFTRRAFLNGKMDLLQAEAVADVIQAQSVGSLQVAYGLLGGELSQRVGRLRDDLIGALARLESLLDFSEDVAAVEIGNIDQVLDGVQRGATALVDSFRGARARLVGFSVVLVGRPNAGKSTLFNSLLGEERSIVTDVPGTTRDWVEGHATWAGETVRLIDTAGLRDTGDVVELAGVRRTVEQAEAADLVLHVVDASDAVSWKLASQSHQMPNAILVGSKADLIGSSPDRTVPAPIAVSAVTGKGLAELRELVLERLSSAHKNSAGPVRERHRDALAEVAEAVLRARKSACQENTWELAAAELQSGLRHIGGLLGENVDDAVLDRIFAEFCIGK